MKTSFLIIVGFLLMFWYLPPTFAQYMGGVNSSEYQYEERLGTSVSKFAQMNSSSVDDVICGEGTELVDGVCHVIKTEKHGYGNVPNFIDALFFMQIILPFFVPGAIIFVVFSKTPRVSRIIRLSVGISAVMIILYFLSGLFLGWYPPVYA